MTKEQVLSRLKEIMEDMNIKYLPSANRIRKYDDGSRIIDAIYKYGNFKTFANMLGTDIASNQEFTRGKISKGMRFGKLVAIEPVTKDKYGHYLWRCKCDCGNTTIKSSENLLEGKTQSCGCIQKNILVHRNKTQLSKHHLTNHILYSKWSGMKDRCSNSNTKEYKDYGKRGICVCDEWLDIDNGFINFYNWAINNGWKDKLTLDRIDVNGNYCPENCRWITNLEQRRNQRRTVMVEYNGKKISLRELCDLKNMNCSLIYGRLKRGQDLEEALSKPSNFKKYGVLGISYTGSKWGSRIYINGKTIWLGTYSNKVDAIKSRLIAEYDYFGLNAPQSELFSKYGIGGDERTRTI